MIAFNIKKILIATDISVTNNGVLQLAAQLANKAGAEVILFNVLEGSNVIPEEMYLQASTLTDPAKKALEKQKDQLIELGVQKVGYLIERGK